MEIDIRDDTGRPVPSEFDKVVATLFSSKPEFLLLIIMRKQFCCDAIRALYKDYYTRQSGGEVPVLYGARTQGGHGLGSILGGLFRRALPFLSIGAKILGQQAMDVASDMIDGKSFQDSAKSRLKEGIKIFVTSNPIISQSGSGVRRNRLR